MANSLIFKKNWPKNFQPLLLKNPNKDKGIIKGENKRKIEKYI